MSEDEKYLSSNDIELWDVQNEDLHRQTANDATQNDNTEDARKQNINYPLGNCDNDLDEERGTSSNKDCESQGESQVDEIIPSTHRSTKSTKSLTSVLKNTEQTGHEEGTKLPKHGSPLSTKKTRKISRVEFRDAPRKKDAKCYSSLEFINEAPVYNSSLPQRLKKARQSFSGQPSTSAPRPQRYSVGSNQLPKRLTQDENDDVSQGALPCSENKVFVELDQLDLAERTWRETARWMKYEENVQANGSWSRPQIPFVEYDGFLALKDYLLYGLVFLEFASDGVLDFSHTLATTVCMCGRIERRYRLKLQQIIHLPVLHQGDTQRRLHVKKTYRNIIEKNEAERRAEVIKKAFEISENRVRNLWVHLSQKALMYSKFSAQWKGCGDEDDDCDEAIINFCIGGKKSAATQNSAKNKRPSLLTVPEGGCSGSASECSDSHCDRYPLSSTQENLLKALSADCEGVAMKYAPLDFLDELESFAVLVRMTRGTQLYDFLEVPIDCKFVFLLCASSRGNTDKDLQVCRAFGSLMTDKVFRCDVLLARNKADVIVAVDKYVKDSVLFPPGQWDIDCLKPAAEEISQLSAQRHVSRSQNVRTPPRRRKSHLTKETRASVTYNNLLRKASSALPLRRDTTASQHDMSSFLKVIDCYDEHWPSVVYSPLLAKHPLDMDGRWFGGLRREIARRYPLYWSDIKDAFHVQCIAAIFFVAFGVVALAVTFGKLLVKYTDGYMGDSEMLLATSFSCMLMALLGTEPHTVISGTAAMVITETAIFKAAGLVDIHYLTWRLWIGWWIAFILLLILAFEKTCWIRYCTRFTEEILHSLIAVLFILEAFKDIYKVFKQHPVRDSYFIYSGTALNETNNTNSSMSWSNASSYGRPNTALLHTIFLFSTFGIAIGLRLFQDTRYFTPLTRRLLNFFSIPIAVNVMYLISSLLNVYLNTVEIKNAVKLTSPHKRSWLIDPNLSGKGKLGWGMAVLAVFPAFFVLIVLFIETEITALMCYKETIGRKGSGFHGNILVVAISVFVCSLLGLPWMCLAAVETSNHIDSLRVWTSHNIPGIKSRVERVRQQRVTLFFIGLSAGLFLFWPLSYVKLPIAVLSGLTLYMGVVATFGVQFFKRVELIFIAPSQQPYIEYLANVPLLKVHLFTVIQIVMIALLMVIKSVESISFIFPFFILLMIPTRVLLGKYIFTQEEMEQLDNEAEETHHK